MPDDSAVRLGRAIRDARTQRGWTQDQLAETSGVSRPSINRCENAKTVTSPPVARALFQALDLDPRHLPVLLGYVTDEEIKAPAKIPSPRNPITEEAIGLLEDVPPAVARECLAFLQFRIAQTSSPAEPAPTQDRPRQPRT